MLARTDSRARAVVLLLVVAVAASAIGARLVWWQVVQQASLSASALGQLSQQEELPAERGEITDVNGALLATSIELQSVFATPPLIADPARTARLLAPVLDISSAQLRAKLDGDHDWVWLKRRITPEAAERIRSLDLRGIGMLPETKRVYPIQGIAQDTTLAAQVLGFVDVNGDGQYGIEGGENAILAGTPGAVSAQEDVIGRQIADSATLLREPVDGADLRLTLDIGVQHMLEQEIWTTYRMNGAAGATGLIMNVETGAILAMASYPSYDANDFATTDGDLFSNPAVARQYEPGSVMKAFTVAAATRCRSDHDEGHRRRRQQPADRRRPHPQRRPRDASVRSRADHRGRRAGAVEQRRRGEDRPRRSGDTSCTRPSSASGSARRPASTLRARPAAWSGIPTAPNASGDLTAAQNAFGQGLSLTAVQLAAGYASFANGGLLVTPHVVDGWTDPDGTVHATEQPPAERIMREETAETMVKLLTNAIDNGIATGAKVSGYTVAGKTGTAQIAAPIKVEGPDGQLVERWQYHAGWVDSSFVGLLPAGDTKLVTLVLIHRPAGAGGPSMPDRPENVYARLMPQVLDYLAIPPDRPPDPVAQP